MVPEGARLMDLELKTYELLLKMFTDRVPHLAASDDPLPVIDAQWSGKKHTDAEFEAMKELEANITLRFRAFG